MIENRQDVSKLPDQLNSSIKTALRTARVGHLATVDPEGMPHVVPICFVVNSNAIFSPVDEKPKQSSPQQLGRIRNIRKHPDSTLVVDHYQENWQHLFWIQIRGSASIQSPDSENHTRIISNLRDKYAQYEEHGLESRPLIKLSVEDVISWGTIEPERL